MARMSLDELRTRASTVDRAKVDATTEAEIETHRAADGDADLDVTSGGRVVESPRALRVRLAMTQPEMAAALSIPLGTWRNWEQGRVNLEPAASALLKIVSRSPAVALAALAGEEKPEALSASVDQAFADKDDGSPEQLLIMQIEEISAHLAAIAGKSSQFSPTSVASSLAGQGVNLLELKRVLRGSRDVGEWEPAFFPGAPYKP